MYSNVKIQPLTLRSQPNPRGHELDKLKSNIYVPQDEFTHVSVFLVKMFLRRYLKYFSFYTGCPRISATIYISYKLILWIVKFSLKKYLPFNYNVTQLHYHIILVEVDFSQNQSNKRMGIFRLKTVLSNTVSSYGY